MLDALEWAVNKTRLGDSRPSTRRLLQPTLLEDQNSPGQVARQINGIRDNERCVSPPAPLDQPTPEAHELKRRKVAKVDEMESRVGRDAAPPRPELLTAQVVDRRSCSSLAELVSEPAHNALIHGKETGDAQQQRRTTGSGRANDRRDFAAFQLEADLTQNRIRCQT